MAMQVRRWRFVTGVSEGQLPQEWVTHFLAFRSQVAARAQIVERIEAGQLSGAFVAIAAAKRRRTAEQAAERAASSVGVLPLSGSWVPPQGTRRRARLGGAIGPGETLRARDKDHTALLLSRSGRLGAGPGCAARTTLQHSASVAR